MENYLHRNEFAALNYIVSSCAYTSQTLEGCKLNSDIPDWANQVKRLRAGFKGCQAMNDNVRQIEHNELIERMESHCRGELGDIF
jgi:hypothetical protein